MSAADILLVDDDPDCCASMADILADLGYTVGVAHDGPAALECYQRKAFRLALLDFKMPGMDGLELSRRLKGWQPPPEVVLVTGYAPEAEAVAQAGVRRVLVKPVNFAVLIPLVQEVLDGPPQSYTTDPPKASVARRRPGLACCGHHWDCLFLACAADGPQRGGRFRRDLNHGLPRLRWWHKWDLGGLLIVASWGNDSNANVQ